MLREAIAVAVEAFSLIEDEGLGERTAIFRAARHVGAIDRITLRLAFLLTIETIRHLNQVDAVLLNLVSHEETANLSLGCRSFLRLFTYWTRLAHKRSEGQRAFIAAGRRVIGRKEFFRIEKLLPIISAGGMPFNLSANENLRLALQLAAPSWLISRLAKSLGRNQALHIVRSWLQRLPTYVALNPLAGRRDFLARRIEKERIRLEPVTNNKHAYRVVGSAQPLIATGVYKDGLISLQDLSTILAVEAADLSPRDEVLDVCCAPGLKTCLLAAQMKNRGSIISLDLSRNRMSNWMNQAARMMVRIAHPIICDASRTLPFRNEFDLVLVDPPCTNSGVISRSPSIKWRLSPDQIGKFSRLQSGILSNCADAVKPGGSLLYTTCSIFEEENERVIAGFLATRTDFWLVKTDLQIGSPGLRGLTECIRLYPDRDRCNGFFIAKMIRS